MQKGIREPPLEARQIYLFFYFSFRNINIEIFKLAVKDILDFSNAPGREDFSAKEQELV